MLPEIQDLEDEGNVGDDEISGNDYNGRQQPSPNCSIISIRGSGNVPKEGANITKEPY